MLSAVEQWAERASTVRDSRKLDAFIAMCCVVLTLLMCSMLVASFVSNNRSVVFNASSACSAPLLHYNKSSRHDSRMFARV